MQSVDLNLLEVLDALLQEGSVTRAAERLHLSPPAVSRSLTRLRRITGDPLLVRAGRTLVPTPAAEAMRGPAHEVLAAAQGLLSTRASPSDADLERSLDAVLTVRTGTDAAEEFGPDLLAAITARAPAARLRLVGEGDESAADLRDGTVDLDLGAPITGDEGLRHETLTRDVMVLVGRRDGALARRTEDRDPTAADLAVVGHVNASRRGVLRGPLDEALEARGEARTVVATAPGFSAACTLARSADLVCLAPERLTRRVRGAELRTWPSPVPLPPVHLVQTWHRRTDADPVRRWLRDRVREVVGASGS
ncbi:LysR family transcriptional regulator [Actinomycetospora endophytica]|uniref:LysR family transcriptional regulator n=1 Tax=Actinomycetospora endophytica TaxID=2291215 RepID=A0ABS8PA35_9PSEU|nr:LysR family transcriptional regulator [Actinomycetospora endophytica]MCD2194261.1 LysR family transcriptional regulator [Actinomycetospora endophytica]